MKYTCNSAPYRLSRIVAYHESSPSNGMGTWKKPWCTLETRQASILRSCILTTFSFWKKSYGCEIICNGTVSLHAPMATGPLWLRPSRGYGPRWLRAGLDCTWLVRIARVPFHLIIFPDWSSRPHYVTIHIYIHIQWANTTGHVIGPLWRHRFCVCC